MFKVLILVFTLFLFACNRIERKGKALYQGSKEALKEQSDRVSRQFDVNQPDTRINRMNFETFFGMEVPSDVTNLYFAADLIGIDQDYQFAFNCEPSTISAIVTNLDLEKSSQPNNWGEGIWEEYDWWDSQKIKMLAPYQKTVDSIFFEYLWYDEAKKRAWYFTFDL